MLIGPHEDARLKELPLWVTLAWLNWIDIPASAEERNKNHYGKTNATAKITTNDQNSIRCVRFLFSTAIKTVSSVPTNSETDIPK